MATLLLEAPVSPALLTQWEGLPDEAVLIGVEHPHSLKLSFCSKSLTDQQVEKSFGTTRLNFLELNKTKAIGDIHGNRYP